MANKSFFLKLVKGSFFKHREDPDIELLTKRNTTEKNENDKSNCMPNTCWPDVNDIISCAPKAIVNTSDPKSEPEKQDEEDDSNQKTPSP